MNFTYKIVVMFGMLWIALPAEAQVADSLPVTPLATRTGPPPKRGAPPTRTVNNTDATLNAGKVEWLPRHIDFGSFKQGVPQSKDMLVKNISNQPFKILQVKSSCHCTTTKWPDREILPGETVSITFMHNAEDLGDFVRVVSIQTTFDRENWVMVSVTGNVLTP